MSGPEDDIPQGPQPFLIAFPADQGPFAEDNEASGDGQTVMLDPGYFNGLDEVGLFMADLVRHYARAFVQSGRAADETDAIEQIREMFHMELENPTDEGTGGMVS